MTPTDYANDIFPPAQDALLPASHDWDSIRAAIAQAVRHATETAMRHERAVCVAELRAMAAAFEQSAAADWPDDGLANEHAAFDDGLLTAAGRLRCRASILETEATP